MSRVEHIFVSPGRGRAMQQVAEAVAVPGCGLEGCAHGRAALRQVLLMDIETLAELGLEPGVVKENLTVRGLDMGRLERGQRLRVGQALLETTIPCAPCEQMEAIRPGLQEAIRGRRGVLFRVVEGGRIRPGDEIVVVEPAE